MSFSDVSRVLIFFVRHAQLRWAGMAGFSYGTFLPVLPLGAHHSFFIWFSSFHTQEKGKDREKERREGTGRNRKNGDRRGRKMC